MCGQILVCGHGQPNKALLNWTTIFHAWAPSCWLYTKSISKYTKSISKFCSDFIILSDHQNTEMHSISTGLFMDHIKLSSFNTKSIVWLFGSWLTFWQGIPLSLFPGSPCNFRHSIQTRLWYNWGVPCFYVWMWILCSAVLAHIMLNERLNLFGILGCTLCITGSVTIVLHAPDEREIQSLLQVWRMALQPGTLLFSTKFWFKSRWK